MHPTTIDPISGRVIGCCNADCTWKTIGGGTDSECVNPANLCEPSSSFREDYRPRAYWGPLPQLEWTALGMTAGTLAALARGRC